MNDFYTLPFNKALEQLELAISESLDDDKLADFLAQTEQVMPFKYIAFEDELEFCKRFITWADSSIAQLESDYQYMNALPKRALCEKIAIIQTAIDRELEQVFALQEWNEIKNSNQESRLLYSQ